MFVAHVFVVIVFKLAWTNAVLDQNVKKQLLQAQTMKDLHRTFQIIDLNRPKVPLAVPLKQFSSVSKSSVYRDPSLLPNFDVASSPQTTMDTSQSEPRIGELEAENGIEDIQPKQSSDKCEPFEVCVPVPLGVGDGDFLFPTCITLPRCLGSCCEKKNNCHALSMSLVRFEVKTLEVTGNYTNDGQPIIVVSDTQTAVMEKHLSCGCQNCDVNIRRKRCTQDQQIGNDCQCHCKNSTAASHCIGANYKWNKDKCQCQCNLQICPPLTVLDLRKCRCAYVQPLPIPSGGATARPFLQDLPRFPNFGYFLRP